MLIGLGVLNDGGGFAVDRQDDGPLGIFQVPHDVRRVIAESGHGLDVFGDVHVTLSGHETTLLGIPMCVRKASIDFVVTIPPQSGKSNNRHHPVGLISPSTTAHDLGRRKNVHPTQLNPPRGVS
jgi:hypothetical protein